MKKSMFLILMAGLFWACDKDEFNENVQSVSAGNEILFAGSFDEGISTRTEYGDLAVDAVTGKNYFPVYWVTGDEIVVSCPEAHFPSNPSAQPFQKAARYTIEANLEVNKETAAAIKKSSDKALQWGDAQIHRFYSVYPASAVQSADAEGFVSTISENQIAKGIKSIPNETGEGVAKIIQPNMSNAFMLAYSTYDKSKPTADGTVNLPFKPLSTVLEITIHGPEEANTEVVNISKVTVTSPSGKSICGKYKMIIDAQGQIASSQPIESGVVNTTITASTTLEKGVELRKGDKAVYKIFLAPDVSQDDVLAVSVSTQFGTLTKTLNKTHIQPQKVNRVTLPQIKRDATNNNWMSDLDPNIYITELSYPGSKLSVIDRYQNVTLKEQLREGVRAFIIQSNIQEIDGVQQLVVASENGAVTNPETNAYIPVVQVVDSISHFLTNVLVPKGSQEFAFIMFTYCGAGSLQGPREGYSRLSPGRNWMRIMTQTCRDMAADPKYRIYQQEVTPNTTIGDVAGQVLLKANYNGTEMETESNAGENAPVMLSHWMSAYPQGEGGGYPDGIPLYWGKTNNPATMKWFYQEVTTVSNDGSESEASYDEKVNYMNLIFQRSVDLYNSPTGLHDIWFVNDLGGRLVNRNIALGDGEEELAKLLHPLASTTLRQRDQNAALGLIFINFADRHPDSGQLYGSDWLIQTIIDNNFKFALRKKSGAQPAPAPTKASVAVDDDWDR